MQKYYLLTFNEDWADEHNVPALTCFTEKEYQKWAAAPTGEVNLKYDSQKAEFDRALKAYNANPRESPYINSYHDEPKKFFSGIHASLGNNGDGFGDSFINYKTGKALVDANIVSVHEVPKEFFEVFKEVDLSSLSLCNVFDEDLAENVYENDDEY